LNACNCVTWGVKSDAKCRLETGTSLNANVKYSGMLMTSCNTGAPVSWNSFKGLAKVEKSGAKPTAGCWANGVRAKKAAIGVSGYSTDNKEIILGLCSSSYTSGYKSVLFGATPVGKSYGNGFFIIESGKYVSPATGKHVGSDKRNWATYKGEQFGVRRNGKKIEYVLDGKVVHTSAKTATGDLYPCFTSCGGTVEYAEASLFDAKYPAFTKVPFSKIKMCVGSKDKNCVEHKFTRDYANAKALFAAGYLRDKTVDQKGILKAFGPAKDSYQSCPMQRPGFNIQCNDGNKARWGYCTNCASQPCQNADSNDADASIGIGLAGQSTPRQMGAGWTNYFASGKGTCSPNSMTGAHVWFYVYQNLML